MINADSMQVYRELRILTARPTVDEEAAVPHVLYGVRPAAEPGSAAWWRERRWRRWRRPGLPAGVPCCVAAPGCIFPP